MSTADSHPGVDPTLDALIDALRPLLRKVRTTDSAIKVTKPGGKKQAVWTSEQLTPELMLKHLNGGPPRGVCPMQYGSDVTMVGLFDIDDHDKNLPWSTLLEVGLKLMEVMRSYGLAPIPFRSSSGHGIHVYCLWADPQDAYSVRALMKHILLQMSFTAGTGGVQVREIEIFPKTDRMREQRVRINKKTGKTSVNRGSQFFLPLADKSVPLDPRTLADLPKVPSSISWPDSAPVKKLEKPERVRYSDEPSVELATLRSALAAIPDEAPEMVEYGEWIKMLAATHYETQGSAEGLDMAHEFSARASNYDAAVLDDKWDTFDDDCDRPVTGGTIIRAARGYGWGEVDVNDVFGGEGESAGAGASPAPESGPEPDLSWPGIRLPGVVGELADWIEENAPQRIPQYAVAAALTVVAALSGGQYLIKGTLTPLNLYLFLVADTGTGKDYYLRIAADLLHQIPGAAQWCNAASGVSSGMGLMRRLSKYRTLLLVMDEVGHVLGAAGMRDNANGASLMAEFMSLHGQGAKVYTGRIYANEKRDISAVSAPFLHLIGATTPAKLWNVMKNAHVEEGLLNRVLVISGEAVADNEGDRELRLPDELAQKLTSLPASPLFDEEGESIHVGAVQLWLWPVTDEAREAYRKKVREQKGRGPLWSRAAENALRIAGLIALADRRPIGESDFDVGWQMVEWSITNTQREVEERSFESPHDEAIKKVRAVISRGTTDIKKWKDKCKPGLVPKALVYHQLHRMDKRLVESAIDTLQKAEMVKEVPDGKCKMLMLLRDE